MPLPHEIPRSSKLVLYRLLIFLVGALLGLIHIFIIPPWQHYDEPTHFEYAWLIGNQPELIETGGYVQSLRREIAASMIEHDFFKANSISPPNLLSQTSPIWIGISQTGDEPLYHWLAAIPLRFLAYTDIDTQLYSTRIVSLLLLLVTLGACFGVIAEITSQNSHLRWVVPLSLVLIPGFVDMMTAVNNDVGATAFFSLFIWASIRVIKKDLSLKRLLALITLAIACYLTKNTISVALILIIIPLIFSLLGKTRQRYAWYFLSAIALLGLVSIFSWGDAAQWARDDTFQNANTRGKVVDAPLGTHAFSITYSPSESVHRMYQFLSYKKVQDLQGKDVTLGAWIWADKPLTIRSPMLGIDGQENYININIDSEKRFYAFSSHIPKDAIRLFVILSSFSNKPEVSGTIFLDGIILAEGSFDTTKPPLLQNMDTNSGFWGSKPFTNLLSNASAELSWPRFRPWADKLIVRNYPGSPSLMLTSILDWNQASWYYISAFRYLFISFWAKFSWGQVRLLGRYTYLVLGAITILGFAGSILRIFRRPKELPWPTLFFLAISILIVWGSTIMRGINSLYGQIFIPTARYAYPAMIPSLLILAVGWLEVSRLARNKLHIPASVIMAFWILFWLSLNSLAIFTIYSYFYT